MGSAKPKTSFLQSVTAMKVIAHIPEWVWRPLAAGGAAIAVLIGPRPVRQWQLNAEVATGVYPSARTTRAAVRLWLRNTISSIQLANWAPARIRRCVVVNPAGWQQVRDHLETTGVVAALPHMGSWDLAGAYACLNGLPVSSVAEALPDGQYEYFRDLRATLGLRIYSHRDAGAVAALKADVGEHRLVSLVADRDFSRRGLPVKWRTPRGWQSVTMPPGPALIARDCGATLVGAVTVYEGRHLRITFSEPIDSQPGEAGLVAMTQQLADFFSAEIGANVVNWHMMQRFFPGVRA